MTRKGTRPATPRYGCDNQPPPADHSGYDQQAGPHCAADGAGTCTPHTHRHTNPDTATPPMGAAPATTC
jgi:hypothetical protein